MELMKQMYIDIKRAYYVWLDSNPNGSFVAFLKEIGISRQTAHNMQNGKSKNLPLSVAQKLKELTGKPMDELIKPKNND